MLQEFHISKTNVNDSPQPHLLFFILLLFSNVVTLQFSSCSFPSSSSSCLPSFHRLFLHHLSKFLSSFLIIHFLSSFQTSFFHLFFLLVLFVIPLSSFYSFSLLPNLTSLFLPISFLFFISQLFFFFLLFTLFFLSFPGSSLFLLHTHTRSFSFPLLTAFPLLIFSSPFT